jgi:hypothetical protein
MLTLFVYLSTRLTTRVRVPREKGQASVEYALVLLGAGIVATLVIAWAQKTQLFDDLFDQVLKLVKGKAK